MHAVDKSERLNERMCVRKRESGRNRKKMNEMVKWKGGRERASNKEYGRYVKSEEIYAHLHMHAMHIAGE